MQANISILGQPWKVEHVAGPADEYGTCDPDARTITINPCGKVNLEAVELHEVIHAILSVTGVVHLLTDAEEEAIATALEHGLIGAGYRRTT